MKTTNYENSKKLAEIGFYKPSNFMIKSDGKIIATHKQIIGRIPSFSKPTKNGCDYLGDGYATYDLETILDHLPKRNLELRFYEHHEKDDENNIIGYEYPKIWLEQKEDESLADTATRLIVKLHKAGIINFNK